MARVARSRIGAGFDGMTAPGVYQWLLDRQEEKFRNWQRYGPKPIADYDMRRPLEALRAGRPVIELVCNLPEWAQPPGTPPQARTSAEVAALGVEYQRRRNAAVVIHADDRVVPHDAEPGESPPPFPPHDGGPEWIAVDWSAL